MKKIVKLYVICWALCLALFNIITFVTPTEIGGVSKFSTGFWVAYACITLAFLGQLLCTLTVIKPTKAQRSFLNLPIISISFIAIVVMLVIGTIFEVFPTLPSWIAIIVCFVVLIVSAIIIIFAYIGSEAVSATNERVKDKTQFIRTLTADAEALNNATSDAVFKLFTNKIYESVRYSDPMSSVELKVIEEKIQNSFDAFSQAVINKDEILAESETQNMLALLAQRNSRCKMLK